MRVIAILCLSILLTAAVSAAPLERDLGKGLAYYRITASTPGLPSAKHPGSAVLDLRYAESSAVTPKDLEDWLLQNATAPSPVFVLANLETAPELRALLARLAPHAHLLVIGAATADFHPDIAIAVSADAERTAYDALQSDTDITALVTPALAKPRHDEAAIMAARSRGESEDEETEPQLTDDDSSSAMPMVDPALQRAVHLHRAWLILGAKRS